VRFRSLTLDELQIDDERSFKHVALYDALKQALRRDGYRFRVMTPGRGASWDRALFLNLTFWDGGAQGDVLKDEHLDADVVAHVAWHHLAHKALEAKEKGAARTVPATLLAESIASAFDLYLVGRLLGHAPEASFLETQVPAMAEVAAAAGLNDDDFEELLEEVAADPDRAFEDLRALLFDVCTALLDCAGVVEAAEVIARFEGHRFAPLLHHYELSNWILSARALAGDRAACGSAAAQAVDEAIRRAPVALDWLEAAWLGE
jgi:hypothetical protein